MTDIAHRVGLKELADTAAVDGEGGKDERATDGQRLRELLAAQNEKSKHLLPPTILAGDCIAGLKMLPDHSVNLVVTSPPYNVGKNYAASDDKLPYPEYIDFTKAWLEQCHRVLAPGALICVNLPVSPIDGRLVFMDLYQLLRQVGFWHQDFIGWVKWNGKNLDTSGFAVSKRKLFSKRRTRKLIEAFEVILVLRKPPAEHAEIPELNVDPVEVAEMNYNLWHIQPIWDKAHPAPFPEEVPRRLIELYSQPGDTVLDPFLGTGTTMKVAHALKRHALGCELSAEYVALMQSRFDFPVRLVHVRNEDTQAKTHQTSLGKCDQ